MGPWSLLAIERPSEEEYLLPHCTRNARLAPRSSAVMKALWRAQWLLLAWMPFGLLVADLWGRRWA